MPVVLYMIKWNIRPRYKGSCLNYPHSINSSWCLRLNDLTCEDLCARRRYQEQGQVITSHGFCGMLLLIPALDACLWHTCPIYLTCVWLEPLLLPEAYLFIFIYLLSIPWNLHTVLCSSGLIVHPSRPTGYDYPNERKVNLKDSSLIDRYLITTKYRADSRFAPSQWETALLCNDVSHWLNTSLKHTMDMLWEKFQ